MPARSGIGRCHQSSLPAILRLTRRDNPESVCVVTEARHGDDLCLAMPGLSVVAGREEIVDNASAGSVAVIDRRPRTTLWRYRYPRNRPGGMKDDSDGSAAVVAGLDQTLTAGSPTVAISRGDQASRSRPEADRVGD